MALHGTISIIFATVANSIVSVIILIVLLYRQCRQDQNKTRKCCTPRKTIQNLTYAAITSFILCASIAGITYILKPDSISARIITFMSGIVLWHVGIILMYILLMLRVHHAFKGTQYASSKRIKIIFAVLLCICIICLTAYPMGAIIFIGNGYHESDEESQIFINVWTIGTEISDLMITVFLIRTFVKKMLLLAVNMHNSFVDDPNELNKQQKVLLNIMTKYFVLSAISAFATQLLGLIICAYILSLDFDEFEEGVIITIIIVFGLQLYVNNICLFLTFDVNDVFYQKCCKCCDRNVMSYFQKRTQRKVTEKHYELRTRLLTEGSNVGMIQESVSKNSKISMSRPPSEDLINISGGSSHFDTKVNTGYDAPGLQDNDVTEGNTDATRYH